MDGLTVLPEDITENEQQAKDMLNHLLEQSDNVKQRSPEWFFLRKHFLVTGSTLNNAIGLNSLKKQKEHFDAVVEGKRPQISSEQEEAMSYGTENEINGVATIVSKILPVLKPNIKFIESGCKVVLSDGKPFMLVSPDGEGKANDHTVIGFEVKCPTPGKVYTPQVHYSVPKYYMMKLCEYK